LYPSSGRTGDHRIVRDVHGAYPAGTWIRSPHMSHHRPFTEAEGATILVKVGHLQVAG
jgi:hypothetical protein